MAPQKRKRNSTPRDSNKRSRYIASSDSEHTTNTSPQYWAADSILDERTRRGKRQYLIKWKGTNLDTGREWEPTWEPEQNANELLVASWEQEKPRRGIASTSGSAQSNRRTRHPREQQQAQEARRRNRRSRVVASSPEPFTAHSTTVPPVPSVPLTLARDSAASIADQNTLTTPISASASPKRASPCIQIAPRGSSFDPDEFDAYSQIVLSQRNTATPAPSRTQETDLDSSQLFAAARPFSSGIVPDSQSSASEASFIPTTQQTEDTNQQSTNTIEPEEDEEVTEDSGILEIIQEAALAADSPARSIPETIPDTVVDSQSQHQRTGIEGLREIPNTFETVESSPEAIQAVPEDEGQNTRQQAGQQVSAERDIERRQDEQTTQEDDTRPNPAGSASQSALESSLQPVVYPGSPQERDESSTQAQAVPLESGEVADSAEKGVQVVPEDFPTVISDSRPSRRQPEQVEEDQITDTTSKHPTAHDSQTILAEHSVPEENAQFPFHSQHLFQHLQPDTQIANQCRAQEDSVGVQEITDLAFGGSKPIQSAQSEEVQVQASGESTTIPESSHTASEQSEQPAPGSSPHCQAQDNELLSESLEAGYSRSSLLVVEQLQQTKDQDADSNHTSRVVTEEIVRRRDFALHSQAPHSSIQFTQSREQNAQILPLETDFSTQEDASQSIRPTIEREYVVHRASSGSRHDSSQETPERQFKLVENSSSPIPPPPSHLSGTLDSNLPPRPPTPIPISSSSIMASHNTGEEVKQELKERLAKRQAENPWTPKRRIMKSSLTPSATAPTPDSVASAPTSARRFLQTNAPSSATAAEGTRSPSTVPDRSPAPQGPTSLRTVAIAPSSSIPVAESLDAQSTSNTDARPEPADIEVMVTAEESAMPSQILAVTEPEGSELSDVDDDTESLLNDDLNVEREEYIVPLFMEGRQSDMYLEYTKHKNELLLSFLNAPREFARLAEVEEVVSYLRALETHIDLVYAEATPDSNSATQIEFAAQFGMENSAKFRFLHSLFHHLRDHDKHVVLVTEKDHDKLFDILETFCKAKFVNYDMPTRSRQADPAHIEGTLAITIFPGDASPIIRAPDVIVCLDGFQEASQIRQKNWARSSDQDIVPVLHLVIPRTIGHIERYISPALDHRERLHTVLASLAQIQGDIGKPIDEDTPRAPVAAQMVVDWLTTANDDEGLSWPLPSIGSVKNVIEYQSQMSQESPASITSPAPERNKRPLDDEDLDPAKRMRFTPQPQAIPSSSINNEHEITHISDSMPGTAADEKELRKQLARIEEAYQKERAARKAEQQRFRDQEVMWDKQQTVHEDLTRDYRLLLGQQKTTEEQLQTMTKNNETLRERLANRTTEMRQLSEQLNEQRATHLLSTDERIAEITRLRKDLATAQEEKQRALRTAQTAESTLEYMKEQYRNAQDAATSSQSTIDELTATNAKLQHQASGEPAKLKAMHFDRQYETQDRQLKSMRAENANLKKALNQSHEELQRMRNNPGRVGVGTRAQSVTPQPKTRSRAGSPIGGRLSHLRNG